LYHPLRSTKVTRIFRGRGRRVVEERKSGLMTTIRKRPRGGRLLAAALLSASLSLCVEVAHCSLSDVLASLHHSNQLRLQLSSPTRSPGDVSGTRLVALSEERIPMLLRLRGGRKKNRHMGKKVRQLHNYVPKQRRAHENPLQINKPHRKRKKAKEREAAAKRMRNVQNSVKTGEGREELYSHGLIDRPEMSAKARLGDNFIDLAQLNGDENYGGNEWEASERLLHKMADADALREPIEGKTKETDGNDPTPWKSTASF
jgi:hypothetical protein